ncbi:MAG TPA: methionyl-tRNA formyltransferase, partial [Spirochaetota bacterium]|nr:methionyl-tRNA formyltransferase [Spirochaetota bacterium]
ILTQTDKPRGRSKTLVASDVAAVGDANNIKVYKSDKNTPELIDELKKLNADLFVVFAYGVILKNEFLEITKYGGINIHPSLLPLYRGASPMQSAILNGDKKSGITIQTVKLKVDSGDVLYQKEFDILDEDDIFSVENRVSAMSSEAILEFLDKFEKKEIKGVSQNENNITKCSMFKKEDGLIDWNESAKKNVNKIRAFAKWPVCFTFLDGKKLLIHKARIADEINSKDFDKVSNGTIIEASSKGGIVVKTGDSFVSLLKLQIEGKKSLDYKDFLNGHKNLKDKKFDNKQEVEDGKDH